MIPQEGVAEASTDGLEAVEPAFIGFRPLFLMKMKMMV